MIESILLVAGGVLSGVVIALKVIAPRTGNKTDDKVLAVLDKYGVPLVEYLEALYHPVSPPKADRELVRDMRTKD